MTLFTEVWERLDRLSRIGLVFCLIILFGALIGASIWLFRPEYQVLFSELAPADAAAMTAELDRMKIPYRLDGDGNTITVPAEQVYKTRLKLVGRDLPLHGTIGFELFNNADIGMTEFAQKVNYQRALQGELTRTILSYEEIQAARVHLALPEQSLFKKTNAQAKASVSLTLKPGKTLQLHEVQGIQRLVAASVPDIHEEDVTVIDQHGVALTHGTGGNNDNVEPGSANLDSKETLEKYLTRKVTDVLDHTFGVGQGIASVDIVFNRDAVKTTTENVLGVNGNSSTGIVIREHQTSHDVSPSTQTTPAAANTNLGANTTTDVDYQVGRRVEQVVSSPGAIKKINVAVVVRQSLDAEQINRIRDIVSMAAGIDKTRGDGIAVYSITQFGIGQNTQTASMITAQPSLQQPITTIQGKESDSLGAIKINLKEKQNSLQAIPTQIIIFVLLCLLAFVVLLLLVWQGKKNIVTPALLTIQEKEELLVRVREWLNTKSGKFGDPA